MGKMDSEIGEKTGHEAGVAGDLNAPCGGWQDQRASAFSRTDRPYLRPQHKSQYILKRLKCVL